jgi:transcriptional regulator with XRE-family HTH domain
MRSKTDKEYELSLPIENVSERIRAERIKKGYTQALMAHELGISEKAYQNIENKINQSITINRINEIAKILNVSWYEFLSPQEKYTQVNGNNSNNSNHLNLYQSDQALAQENTFQKKEILMLEKRIEDLEKIVKMYEEKEVK